MDDVLSASDEPSGPLTDESDTAAAIDKTDITPESSDDSPLDVLGDNVSWNVLLAYNHTPMTIKELTESCEVSESTVYYRLETLPNLGLAEWTQRADVSSKMCYETAADGLSVHLDDGLCIEAGSSNYVVDAMYTLPVAIDIQQFAYDHEQNSVDVRFRLVPTLLDSLVESYVRDTDPRKR